MPFSRTDISQGKKAQATQLLQLIEALEGDSGKGQPIILTALSSSSARALDVRNLGTGGALRVIDSAGATVLDISDTAYTLSPTSGTNISLTLAGAGGVVMTGGAPSGGADLFTITGGAHTAVIVERSDVIVSARTITITGAITTQRFTRLMRPTVSAATAQTVTNCASLYIENEPATAGAGPAAITNAMALWIDDGVSRFDGRLVTAKGANVASASTLTLGRGGNLFNITGTTTINVITTTEWQAGSVIILYFTAALTVTHNSATPPANTAAILLSGAANFSATADDTLTLVYDGTTWRELARTAI